MIDPANITNYNQTESQLQEFLLFWVFAAGHNAKATAKSLDLFLSNMWYLTAKMRARGEDFPFIYIKFYENYFGWDEFVTKLSKSGLGCWRIKSNTIRELIHSNINLHTCTVDDLELITGIGPKTARCFLMHSRDGMRLAGLDTHCLKFLREQGYNVPKSTPTGKKYKELEQVFLAICDEAGKTPAEYDLEIWNYFSKTRKKYLDNRV